MLVENLEGALLDYWVAMAGEEWKSAHHLYPTMTLDSTFSGVELRDFPRGAFGLSELTCVLMPRNPFRQEPQPFLPSSEWARGGPIIERSDVSIEKHAQDYSTADEPWYAECGWAWSIGATPLIAAMRAYVVSKLGNEVKDA